MSIDDTTTTSTSTSTDYTAIKRHGLNIKKQELIRPAIAYPTLVLFVISLLVFISIIFIRIKHLLLPQIYREQSQLSYAISIPITTAAMFALFTPMHDAAHMSISRQYRWLNYIVGRVVATIFNAPFPAFQCAHLDHHKYTNDPIMDPDYWSARAPSILMPFRWMTQEYHYYVTYLSDPSRLSAWVWFETLTHVAIAHTVMAWIIYQGHGWLLFYTYLLPLRCVIFCLGYAFDYIPHRPHHTTRADDIYATTSRVDSFFSHGDGKEKNIAMDIMLLYQNYHNIHHLYPFIPFYAMSSIWHNHVEELLSLGTPVTSIYDSQQPMRWNNDKPKQLQQVNGEKTTHERHEIETEMITDKKKAA